jgi:hypothetical protein
MIAVVEGFVNVGTSVCEYYLRPTASCAKAARLSPMKAGLDALTLSASLSIKPK